MLATDIIVSIILGFGLSACCGLRAFVPPLIIAIAAQHAGLHIERGFECFNESMMLWVCACGAIIESVAVLHSGFHRCVQLVAVPACFLSASLITSSHLGATDPWLQWILSIGIG